MFVSMYVKEMKQFFRRPFHVVFMLATPILLILLMGFAMSNMIGNKNTMSDSKTTVLYLIEDGTNSEYLTKISEFRKYVENEMNITWKEIDNFDIGSQEVDRQAAVGLIKVSSEGFYYYRSPYNEPTESKMLRALAQTLLNTTSYESFNSVIETKEVKQKTMDSYTYFTFSELGLIMIYLSLIIGQSVFYEKESRTLDRIYTSKASISKMLFSKIAVGCTVGVFQILLVYFLSTVILKVSWGNYTILICFLYLLLALFSSTLGALLGLFIKNKTALNDKILVIAILIGFMGGGLTPLSFLESVKLVAILCKISPLFWITNATITLSAGLLNSDYIISIIMCSSLVLVMVGIYLILKRKEKVRGIYNYE